MSHPNHTEKLTPRPARTTAVAATSRPIYIVKLMPCLIFDARQMSNSSHTNPCGNTKIFPIFLFLASQIYL